MTDNEIVKALECCSYDNCFMLCDECPLKNDGCVDVLIPSVLSLIKRQQAEIKVCERIVRDLHLDDLEREAIQATAVTAAIRDMERALETAKAKAVREFAERLCADRVANDPVVIAVECKLKEMEGENDG